MRRIGLLAFVVALAALFAFAPSAKALTLYTGEFHAKLTDASTLYTAAGLPRAPQDIDPIPYDGNAPAGWADTGPVVGDENRAIINVQQFLQGGSTYYSLPDGELTGLMYDLELVAFTVDASGVWDLYFAPLLRNPLPGLATDPDAPANSGGVIELWFDPTPDGAGETLYNPNADGLAPQAWVEGTGGADRDKYPTVNDAADDSSLWLSAVLAPLGQVDTDGDGVVDTWYVLHEEIRPYPLDATHTDGQSGEIVALAFMNIIGGSIADYFVRDGIVPGTGWDLSIDSNFLLPSHPQYGDAWDNGNWAVQSDDPVRGGVFIPEPATLSLLGLGVLGLAARRKRKK